MNPSRARKRRAAIAGSILDPETRLATAQLEKRIPDPADRKAYLDAIIPELDRLIELDRKENHGNSIPNSQTEQDRQ